MSPLTPRFTHDSDETPRCLGIGFHLAAPLMCAIAPKRMSTGRLAIPGARRIGILIGKWRGSSTAFGLEVWLILSRLVLQGLGSGLFGNF